MNLEMGEVDGWIPDWFPKVEKEESRKWEPVDGIQEKYYPHPNFLYLFIGRDEDNFSLTILSCGQPG